jgi:hypothetical protein
MKKNLLLPLFVIVFVTAQAQHTLELNITNATTATLSYQPTSGGAVTALAGGTSKDIVTQDQATSFKVKVAGGVRASALLKVLDCPGETVFIEGKAHSMNISTKGVLTTDIVEPFKIGSRFGLDVYIIKSNSDSTLLNTWTIKTDQPELKKCKEQRFMVEEETQTVEGALTGIVYYDAIILEKAKDSTTVKTILSVYAGTEITSLRQALLVYRKNPYITAYLKTEFKELVLDPGKIESLFNAQSVVNNALKAAGGLDVTNLAHGFAKFLVKRTKEELNVAFFTRFKEELEDPKYRDLQTVFPQTYRALQAIGEDIYNYQTYIQTLRECFEKDLAGILTNLPQVMDNHAEFFKKEPELEAILRSGFYIAKALQNKKHPGDILADYPENYLNKSDSNFRAGLRTMQVLSKSLRYYNPDESESDESQYWITQKQLKKLYNNRHLQELYLGLLQENIRKANITFRANRQNVRLDSIMALAYPISTEIQDNIPSYEQFIKSFSDKFQDVEQKIETLKGIKKDSVLIENYYSFFGATLDLMRHAVEIETLPYFPELGLREKTDKYFQTAQTASDLVLDVNRRNYSAAIVNAHHLFSLIYNNKNKSTLNTMEAELKNNTSRKPKALKLEISILKDSSAVMSYFYKYGTFMASVVQAKSSDEVAAAIEAFALPSGSSRIKRESDFNVSLNAYVGLFTGFERINKVDEKFKLNSFGVTAPIGVAVSSGKCKFFGQGEGHWSYSLFVSVIDLGSVTSYRFDTHASDTASVDQVPTIQLKDIFSPGVFFSIGIPKSPISINLGTQMGPNLRKVTTNNLGLTNEYSNAVYWRYSLSILVDIPILNFYTRTAKNK